jgi:hypothetical protein
MISLGTRYSNAGANEYHHNTAPAAKNQAKCVCNSQVQALAGQIEDQVTALKNAVTPAA